MKKTLWLYLETTGFDAKRHGIIQIAMLMEIDGKIEGELAIDVQPFKEDKFAMFENNGLGDYFFDSVEFDYYVENDVVCIPSGIAFKDIKEKHIDPKEAHAKISAFLDSHISKFDKTGKAYLGGYNINFDRGFISQFFKKCGDNYLGSYLNWRCLDPLYVLWQMDFDGDISLENYKLETACKHFGIEISAHNALSDIKGTYELHKILGELNEPSTTNSL